jgi:acetyltransferase
MESPRISDPAHDLFRPRRQALDAIFHPKTVAVIGASERKGSVGRTLLKNLISTPFGGTVFPINNKRSGVLGIKAYPTIADVPEPVDLAVIVTPAPTVPGVVRECVAAGVKGAIVISAGFKEIGEEGARLEAEILEEARKGRMRIIGPNCLGVMRPPLGLNATFATTLAASGNVALISQSGGILTAILDWSLREHVGFSAFVSVGSMLDVDWGDLISYLGDDPKTKSILIYMESIGNARSFLSAAREVALRKPIIIIKAGRTEQAAKAAASHTGSLAGSDDVLDAAFRRSGVLRVDSIAELFYMAETLAKQPRPEGPNLTILTNAGGPGVLATDELIRGGGQLARLSDETVEQFNTFLPDAWSHGNPVDMLGDAAPDRYARSLETAAADPNSDGLLVVLTPQDMTDPTETAVELRSYAHSMGKPVLASWMGGSEVKGGERILNEAGIPTFEFPDTATRIFNYMWRYSYNVRGLYETPTLPDHEEDSVDLEVAGSILREAREAGRTLLTEHESKQLLTAYGLPATESYVAESPEEAVAAAEKIGYPVVLKLHSFSITHKSDVGGVELNLRAEADVRDAYERVRTRVQDHDGGRGFDGVTVQPMVKLDGYELIIGSSLDVQFGPVLLFGSGGTLVEVYRDRALALPPLTTTLARRMMEQTKIYRALQGVRGRRSVDLDRLEDILVRFSQLVVEQPEIKEIDINPLLVSESRIVALDARVVLHTTDETERELPRPAIRPYPRQYVTSGQMKDGSPVTFRPIRPEDEPLIATFHHFLSERSVYFRYADTIGLDQRVAHERLSRLCFIDYDREIALVAEHIDPETGENEILAVGRLTRAYGSNEAEFALIVRDRYQGQGLGVGLLERLVDVGRAEGLDCIFGDILAQNVPMRKLAERLGFEIVASEELDDQMLKAVLVLRETEAVS